MNNQFEWNPLDDFAHMFVECTMFKCNCSVEEALDRYLSLEKTSTDLLLGGDE